MAPPDSDSDRHVKPLAAVLQEIDKGGPHTRASQAFADAFHAVHTLGGKAEVTVKLTIKPLAKGNLDQLTVTAEVTSKIPKEEPRPSVFFYGRSGEPTRDDPHAHPTLDLRIADAPERRIVGEDE